MDNDTIAAIATGLRSAGISIIRISGPLAFSIGDKIFRAASQKSEYEMKSFTAGYGHIIDNGRIIDEVILMKMAAPSTYTREDIIEIDCHGGIAVTKAVLEVILKLGARLAEPGEFTKRAFLNGRIDLSQAEAVSDLIASQSEAAVKNSIKQLNGNIRDKISFLRNELLSKTAYIEAALDDPEHISLDGFSNELENAVVKVYAEIKKLIDSFESGRIIKNGINTVILGSPNVGKSSLLNRLLGEDRAIVTDIAGTTRDILSESVYISGKDKIQGIQLNIIDTAGLRQTGDIIEKIGVDKAKKAAAEADLIFFMVDSSRDGFNDEECRELKELCNRKAIILINKTDISDDASVSKLIDDLIVITEHGICVYDQNEANLHICNAEDESSKTGVVNLSVGSTDIQTKKIFRKMPVIKISAKSGSGVEALEKCIFNLFFSEALESDDEIYISNIRHKELLEKAALSLENVRSAINQGLSEDFYTIDLMDACTSLGMITGEHVQDELADKIFSEFCMGK